MEAHSSVEKGESSENRNIGDVEEDEESTKKRISSHPLFALLIETHRECLKVCLGELGEVGTAHASNQPISNPKARSTELDGFMEAYCVSLRKLKEAMEEPQQGMTSFISATYDQLGKLCEFDPNNPKSKSRTR